MFSSFLDTYYKYLLPSFPFSLGIYYKHPDIQLGHSYFFFSFLFFGGGEGVGCGWEEETTHNKQAVILQGSSEVATVSKVLKNQFITVNSVCMTRQATDGHTVATIHNNQGPL